MKTGAVPDAATVIECDADVVVPPALVALTVNVEDPAVDGVPDSTPVEPFNDNPAGRDPDATANVIGAVPDAANVYEYAVPTVALVGGLSAVKVGGETCIRDPISQVGPRVAPT